MILINYDIIFGVLLIKLSIKHCSNLGDNMVRRLRCATFAHTKLTSCVILVLFLLYYVCMIKEQFYQSSRIGDVQEELKNISTKEKQSELYLEKGFNTNLPQPPDIF